MMVLFNLKILYYSNVDILLLNMYIVILRQRGKNKKKINQSTGPKNKIDELIDFWLRVSDFLHIVVQPPLLYPVLKKS